MWVNNAGRGVSRKVEEVTDEELDQMITVNVKSALYGMQAVLPHFRARGAGQIINVSSFLSRVPMASIRSAYSASKAALNSLTANFRMDLAATDPGIHVTLVMPGMVSTDFGKNAIHGTPAIRPGAGAAPPQTAEAVAAVIVGAIDQPVAEVFTNPVPRRHDAPLLRRRRRLRARSQIVKVFNNILEAIGNTPMVRINAIARDVKGTVYAKIETTNPGNSIKDRMAVKMIEDAERSGALKPGGTIIEGTSGNTGMGLAIAAVVKGYRCVFTTTDKQSKEKADALRAFGAEVIVCPTNVEPEDPRSYYSVSSRLEKEVPNSWKANQYDNPSNATAHYEQTGPEIWEQTGGKIDHLVVGVGTGGTISGVGQVPQGEEPEDQGVGHRHLRVGPQEVQGDRRPRQERDLPVHHRRHRRGLPAEERRLLGDRPLREGHRQGRGADDAPDRARGRDLRRQLRRLGDGRPAAAQGQLPRRAT